MWKGTGLTFLTVPLDITDPKLVKAFAHPLRLQILGLLDGRVASPKEVADELGTPLPNTAYHFRQLVSLGFVELVRRKARGGAIEHYYTAKAKPIVGKRTRDELPQAVAAGTDRRAAEAIAEMVAAGDAGRFNCKGAQMRRLGARLDEKGRRAIVAELVRAGERFEALAKESETRLADDPNAESVNAMLVTAFFQVAGNSGVA